MYNKVILFALLLITGIDVSGADTLRIEITRRNKTGANNEKTGEMTVSQKFSTVAGLLFREVRYDEADGELSGYTFYFYRNGRLSGEEIYDRNDALTEIIEYQYDINGHIILSTHSAGPGNKIPEIRIVRTYNRNGLVTKEKNYRKGRLSVLKKYRYGADGRLASATSAFRPTADTTVKSSVEEYSYNNAGKTAAVSYKIQGRDESESLFTEQYTYNDNGLLSSVIRKDGEGNVISEKTFTYYAVGTLRETMEKDGNGRVITWFTKEYRTSIMNIGIQKSVVDGLIFP